MIPDPLEALLQQLCSGDAAAAEEVFRAYEPCLRKVVRRRLPVRLRARFDSADIVQSIWADLLTGFRTAGWRFADKEHLRAFLIKVTRHRFIDRYRRHATALQREQPLAGDVLEQLPPSPLPQPSEVAEANDLWQRMLALCPPCHRKLLLERREGVPIAVIAARSGLHEDSVRRILRDLAREMALCQVPRSRLSGLDS